MKIRYMFWVNLVVMILLILMVYVHPMYDGLVYWIITIIIAIMAVYFVEFTTQRQNNQITNKEE